MKGAGIAAIVFLAVFGMDTGGFSFEPAQARAKSETKEADVNHDGKADVVYYDDGQDAVTAEADTDYDGKPDVTVHARNGKFESAEVDRNHDETAEKKFENAQDFSEWVNANYPAFDNTLDRENWEFGLIKAGK